MRNTSDATYGIFNEKSEGRIMTESEHNLSEIIKQRSL